MSNVTPHEIMGMTATAFGLLPLGFRGQFFGGLTAKNRPKPLRARQTAVYLILRHTTAAHADIARLFGLLSPNTNLSREQANIISAEIAIDLDFRALVDSIEDQIDALHERRYEDAAVLRLPVAKSIAREPREVVGKRRKTSTAPKARVRAPSLADLHHG
jgi:protoheme ferro-lyase